MEVTRRTTEGMPRDLDAPITLTVSRGVMT